MNREFIGFLIFLFPLAATAATAAEKKLTDADFEAVEECLQGLLSKSDLENPTRSSHLRGNAFLLSTPGVGGRCPFPSPRTIAWARPSGENDLEISFLNRNSGGKLESFSYRVKKKDLAKNKTLTFPDVRYPCQISQAQNLLMQGAYDSSEPVTLRGGSWAFKPRDEDAESAWKHPAKVRAALEAVRPGGKDSEAVGADRIEKLESPNSARIAEELLEEIYHSTVRLDDELGNVGIDGKMLRAIVPKCQKAQERLAELTERNSSRAADIRRRSHDALQRASSIFVSPIRGQPTLQDLTSGSKNGRR